jgi:foldase protein PrsA
VNRAFAQAKKKQFTSTTQYNTFLTQTGQTSDDILFRVRVNELYNKLLKHETKPVTAAAILAYYNQHKSQFGTPASRNLRIVRTKTQNAANQALAALKSGQSWDQVASKYSVDTATKNNGGQIQDVTQGQEEHALDQVAFAAPVNTVKGPVHGTFGWYVVEVTKINPGSQQPLSKAKPTIKQLLTSNAQTAAGTAVNDRAKKNWGSQTLCRDAYKMADCKGYTAPKTTTTGVSPTAPSTATTPTATTPTTTTH